MTKFCPSHGRVMAMLFPSHVQLMAKFWPVLESHVKVIAATLSPIYALVMTLSSQSHGKSWPS